MKAYTFPLLAITSLVALAACDGMHQATASQSQFSQADSNHDGRLSQDEYKHLFAIKAAEGDAAAAQAVKADLTKAQYGQRFETIDRNGDGYLSASETGIH